MIHELARGQWPLKTSSSIPSPSPPARPSSRTSLLPVCLLAFLFFPAPNPKGPNPRIRKMSGRSFRFRPPPWRAVLAGAKEPGLPRALHHLYGSPRLSPFLGGMLQTVELVAPYSRPTVCSAVIPHLREAAVAGVLPASSHRIGFLDTGGKANSGWRGSTPATTTPVSSAGFMPPRRSTPAPPTSPALRLPIYRPNHQRPYLWGLAGLHGGLATGDSRTLRVAPATTLLRCCHDCSVHSRHLSQKKLI